MYEVELKVATDHKSVRSRLEEMGATPVESLRQVDTYYDAPDRNFAETDEALRIRREQPTDDDARTYVTYKGPLVDSHSKTREEAETQVTDYDSMHAILSGLGYEPAADVAKDRTRYELDGCEVVLDVVDGLGEFVEVELETDGELDGDGTNHETLVSLRDQAADVLRSLELDPGEQIQTSYLGLLLERDNRS